MRVLIGCEESQVVTKAFRRLGHDAFSCDIQECSGGHPEWHIQNDIVDELNRSVWWNLIILHPDCTAMAVCGNKKYAKGKPGYHKRLEAIEWTVNLWKLVKTKTTKAVLENPASVIFRYLHAPVQYIQPHQFGHLEQKKTGLALFNLPRLVPTNDVYEEMMKLPKNKRERIFHMPPSPDRSKIRSKTYRGIAEAMAEQWGSLA